MRKRQTELDGLFIRIYEDNVAGRINNEQFRLLSERYTDEKNQIKEDIPRVERRAEELKNSIVDVSRFVKLAKQFTEIDELTPELLHTFIERIEVSERKQKHQRGGQTVTIRYAGIGATEDFAQQNGETPISSAETLTLAV